MTTEGRAESTAIVSLTPVPLRPLSRASLVSILISNYNYAHLAREAIESVLAQTYDNVEILICDDGSTDDSVALFQRYRSRDHRLRLITKSNGGQATGFNAVFEQSRGDIVCFLDTDDVYRRDKVERVVEAFRANPQAGCIVNRLLRVDADGRPQGPLPLLAKLPSGWYGPSLVKAGGVLPAMPGTPGLNFRREVAERMFPLPEYRPLNMCPDMVMLRLAPLLTPIGAIQEPLAEARLHGRNTYWRQRITAGTISRELEICRHLWEAQRDLLDRMNPSISRELAPLETSGAILMQKYMLARLSNDVRAARYRRELMSSQEMNREYTRWFWRASAHLPRPLFAAAINFLVGQSRWKQSLSHIAKLFAASRVGNPRA
jgi:hypothetical protein